MVHSKMKTVNKPVLHYFQITAFCVVAFLLLFASFRCIWGADYWWQWATGKYVSQSSIPFEDVFSYTRAGKPWIELRWLYCLSLFQLENILGLKSVIVAKFLMLFASFFILTVCVKRIGNIDVAQRAIRLSPEFLQPVQTRIRTQILYRSVKHAISTAI